MAPKHKETDNRNTRNKRKRLVITLTEKISLRKTTKWFGSSAVGHAFGLSKATVRGNRKKEVEIRKSVREYAGECSVLLITYAKIS